MFKKAVLAAIAVSFIGAPLAQAHDNRPSSSRPAIHKSESYKSGGYNSGKYYKQKNDHRSAQKKRWSRGQRYNDWRRHQEIRDYKRYGLRKPGRGQHWVKVDNQFLLIAGATGLITAIMATR